MVFQLCRPVWGRFMDTAVLAGALKLPGYDRRRAEFLACNWLPTKWDWVDPLKDANAQIAQIEAGLKSRTQAIAERGYDAQQVDAEIARELEREKRLGLDFRRPASPPAARAPPRRRRAPRIRPRPIRARPTRRPGPRRRPPSRRAGSAASWLRQLATLREQAGRLPPFAAIHLRLPEPHSVEPWAGVRGGTQRRSHVAHQQAGAGSQEHCGFPAGVRKISKLPGDSLPLERRLHLQSCLQFVKLCSRMGTLKGD